MHRFLLIVALAPLLACSSSSDDPEAGGGGGADGGDPVAAGDGGLPPLADAGPGDPDAAPGNIVCQEPANLGRGHDWVRNNPLFVSGLSVNMPEPSATVKSDYYNSFGATAAHLWLDGLPNKALAWSDAGTNRFLSWTGNDGTAFNGQVIGGIAANTPGRIGYQIGDEPQSMAGLMELGTGFDNIRAVDPDALLILNFSISVDAIEDMLSYYGAQIDGDILSYDRYTRTNRTLESLALIRDSALEHGMPYWTWLRSYRGPGESDSSASDMRWNVYSHVLYGFTGFSWFLYQIADASGDGALEGGSMFAVDGNFSSAKTSQFQAAAQLNAELVNIGPVITQLTSTAVRYIPAIAFLQPDGTQNWSPGAGGDSYLTDIAPQGATSDALVGFFKDDCDQVYFMVQNQNHSAGNFPIDSENSMGINLRFDFSGAPANVDTSRLQALDNSTGNVVTLDLTPGDGEQATLSLNLEAGDAIMLKYATGGPFAAQTP